MTPRLRAAIFLAALGLAGAAPVSREQEKDLHRLVANLCIGSGLPQPALYLAETPAAQQMTSSVRLPITSVVRFRLRSMSVPDRQTRMAANPVARAPQTAEQRATLHAGSGWPR
jgi:hypothetical protein